MEFGDEEDLAIFTNLNDRINWSRLSLDQFHQLLLEKNQNECVDVYTAMFDEFERELPVSTGGYDTYSDLDKIENFTILGEYDCMPPLKSAEN